MPWYIYPLAILIGYLIGSLPIGYLVGRSRGVDITQIGSGRTGGTNVFRALGPRWGLLSGLGDALKGVAAVLIVRALFGDELAAALAGAFAVVGHNWSIFLHFRGGAGGGTGAGALLALNPLAGIIIIPAFILILAFIRYASVATLSIGLGSVAVLTLLYIAGLYTPGRHIVFGVIVAIAIVWSLRPNIMRLISGTERRIEVNRS